MDKQIDDELDFILNKLVANAHGLPTDDLPEGIRITSPSLDIVKAKQAIEALILEGRIDELEHMIEKTGGEPAARSYVFWRTKELNKLLVEGAKNGKADIKNRQDRVR